MCGLWDINFEEEEGGGGGGDSKSLDYFSLFLFG